MSARPSATEFEKTAIPNQPGLRPRGLEVLQVSLGLRCNQSCAHCHLDCSPERPETMSGETMSDVLRVAGIMRPSLVDVTGGAPELNRRFRWFIAALREAGHAVQVRTNLSVLASPGFTDLPAFYAARRVGLVASLPCYTEANVDAQRGEGVWRAGVRAVRALNLLGYGAGGGLTLDLVYNPGGAFLPGGQAALEADYRRELAQREGLVFDRLLTLTNMPVGRFAAALRRQGREREYLALLRDSFNPSTVSRLMCRNQVEVGWDGALYDCDFNLALGAPVDRGAPRHISAWDAAALRGRRIVTGEHCFACTAGAGSSCGGALV